MNRPYSNTIRWGIIGCGNVTEVKSGPAFSLAGGSSLVAVMRRDGDKARDYAQRHGVPKWYNKAELLINDPDVDAVYVATPPDSHATYAIKTMEAGKPVYVEKPMAHSYSECLKMIRVAEKNRIPLYVAYYRRKLPYFLKIRELIQNGAIGDARLFNIVFLTPPRKEDLDPANLPWRVIQKIAGAGYFYDLASHQLDIIDFFLGPVSNAKGVTANQAGLYEPEDTVAAVMECESGAKGTGLWSFAAHKAAKTDSIQIIGNKGSLTFSTFEFSPVILKNAEGETKFDLKPPATIQQAFIESMVEELAGDTFYPGNGREAARTSKVMDTILGREN